MSKQTKVDCFKAKHRTLFMADRRLNQANATSFVADRFNPLPNEILCRILSFLPTHNAVATSILSKRWTQLWRSVSSLYFDDESYLRNNDKPYGCFLKFIHAAIRAREDLHQVQPITSFRLQCLDDDLLIDDHDFNAWVESVVKHGLENLHLEVRITDYTQRLSTTCIFSCKTLVVLKLKELDLDVDVFSHIDLPSLKTLHLDDVVFPGPQCLLELISGCPILEDMLVRPLLDDYSTPSYNNFKSLSKLIRADICGINISVALRAFCNVEFLRIGIGIYQLPQDIPIFPNLTHLELISGWDYVNWPYVLAMLNKCPKLQIFVLNMPISYADVVCISPCLVPECLSSQLRKCSITNYQGTKSELHFAKYIMQNSTGLRKMTIAGHFSKFEDKFEMLFQ